MRAIFLVIFATFAIAGASAPATAQMPLPALQMPVLGGQQPPVLICNPQLPATCVNVFGVPQRVENVPLPTPPRQTNCTTNIYGNTAYTTCQ